MKKLRVIFFAGKGGVGKTTTAAATALQCAERGHRTIVLSTDPAHSLSDTFESPLKGEIRTLFPNLDAVEVDPFVELDNNWSRVRDFLSSLLVSLGAEESLAGEIATIPGMDNLFSLLRIKDIRDSGRYDVLIVDMAPTGESLRLLSLPQAVSLALKITRTLEKYLISPVIRPASRVARPLRHVVAPEEVARSWERVLERLLEVRDMLEQRTVTSVRLIVNPERMIINESLRAFTYLNLFGMLTDHVIVNRVLPGAARSGYFAEWTTHQRKHLKEIRDHFSPLPISEIPWFREEVVGIRRLRRLAEVLYRDRDPAELFHAEKPVRMRKTKGEAVFSVQLPFVAEQHVELSSRGNEVIIRLNNQLRTYILPDSFSGLTPIGAEYRDGWLEVRFGRDSGPSPGSL